MFCKPFSDAAPARRVAVVRSEMAAPGIDLAMFSAPQNVCYLTGLDHCGNSAPHHLIESSEGEMALIARARKRVTVTSQVNNARFSWHENSATKARHLTRELGPLAGRRLGVEAALPGSIHAAGVDLAQSTGAAFVEVSDLTHSLRPVKSSEERALRRAAARASDAGAPAAIAAIRSGERKVDVASDCTSAIIHTDAKPPGFSPFLRPDDRIAKDLTAWGDGAGRHRAGDHVMPEHAGCVGACHALMDRMIHLGHIRDEDAAMSGIAHCASDAALKGPHPGCLARFIRVDSLALVDSAGMPPTRETNADMPSESAFLPPGAAATSSRVCATTVTTNFAWS